jgi:hypothetical protein
MQIINSRSPKFVSISNSAISYATCEIGIWSGTYPASVPFNYSLRKNTIGSNTQVSFEISELIRDFLEVTFDGDYETSAESDTACKWVNVFIKAYDVNGVQVGATDARTYLALDGYGYFEQGSDFTMENSALFNSKGDIFLPEFGDSQIAIYTGNNPVVKLINSSGGIARTYTFTQSNSSYEQIKYVSLFPELITNLGFDTATDWSIASTDAIENGILYMNGANFSRIPTTFTAYSGVSYIIRFEVLERSAGGIAFFKTGGVRVTDYINTTGKYSFQFTQTSTGQISFFSNNGFVGAIDNVSVVETTSVAKVNVTNDIQDVPQIVDIKQVEECKYEPHKITFVNKNGVLEDMYFFKTVNNSMATTRESYNANTINPNLTYSVNEHNKREFNITANSSTKLSSGFLNESTNERFKQLLLSEKVWITRTFENDELVLPLNIKTSSIAYKTSLNNRLVEYTIEFIDSYNAINNIR